MATTTTLTLMTTITIDDTDYCSLLVYKEAVRLHAEQCNVNKGLALLYKHDQVLQIPSQGQMLHHLWTGMTIFVLPSWGITTTKRPHSLNCLMIFSWLHMTSAMGITYGGRPSSSFNMLPSSLRTTDWQQQKTSNEKVNNSCQIRRKSDVLTNMTSRLLIIQTLCKHEC